MNLLARFLARPVTVAAALVVALAAGAGCRSPVKEAQSRWAGLDVWRGQRIEESIYRIEKDQRPIGTAMLRVYKGIEDLSRFGKDVAPAGKTQEVFRVSFLQKRQSPAGLGEEVRQLDAYWLDAKSLRLRYATQSVQVWNGNVFKELRIDDHQAQFFIHSYLSGVTRGKGPFPDGAIPDGALGFFVRAACSSMNQIEKIPVLVLGSIWLSAAPSVAQTRFEIVGKERFDVAGKSIEARHVEVSNEFGRHGYWITHEAPYPLVQWEGEGRERFVLTSHHWIDWPQ